MHTTVRYSFGDFGLDVAERSLTRRSPPAREDQSVANPVRVPLQPKTFDLLVHLVTHSGRLQTKQALLDEVWGNVVVTESSLTQCIHQLRTALDDTAEQPRFVETVPRVGYRFIASVTQLEEAVAPIAPPAEHVRSYRAFGYALIALFTVAVAYFVADVPSSAPHAPSVAVLAFKNIGNDPGNEALADGIPETLLSMLAQIHELRVIGRTSSFSFKDKDVDLRSIGEALGAGAILEGGVQRSGGRLRVTAQLTSATDGVHLWAGTFDRTTADVFAIQDEIAEKVAEAMKITLAGKLGPGAAGTQNFEAYQLNLEAQPLLRSRQSVKVAQALPKLQRAVELDPNYGDAWVGLSEAYGASGLRSEVLPAIQRALEVAPGTARPHLALGYWLLHRGKDGAGEEMARGLELAPQDSWAMTSVANEYRHSGRYAEAAAMMQRAVKLDPRNTDVRFGAVWAYEAAGDLRGALAQVREILRLEPDMGFAYYSAGGMLYGNLGRMDEALRFLRRARTMEAQQYQCCELVTGYAFLGEDQQATRELASERSLLEPETVLILGAQVDRLAGRDEAPHALIAQALAADPPSGELLVAIDNLGLATARHEAQLGLERFRTVHPEWLETAGRPDGYPPICTLAWSGDGVRAAALLTRWEKHWRNQQTYSMGTPDQNGGTSLARALSCTGRTEEALAELQRLVAGGYHAGGWRSLAADHAFDSIRDETRFQALIEQLRSVAEEERRRFVARPDLEDADIDALTVER